MNLNRAETAQKFWALLDTPELPSLGPNSRPSRWPLPTLTAQIENLSNEAKLPGHNRELICALTFLWHDYLAESHSISQEIPTADGSFIHGIVHRREPDFANAKYWFHRVGEHPAFARIAIESQAILQDPANTKLRAELLKNGKWSPTGFVDLCERFTDKMPSPEYRILQTLQRIETQVLLDHFCNTLP